MAFLRIDDELLINIDQICSVHLNKSTNNTMETHPHIVIATIQAKFTLYAKPETPIESMENLLKDIQSAIEAGMKTKGRVICISTHNICS